MHLRVGRLESLIDGVESALNTNEFGVDSSKSCFERVGQDVQPCLQSRKAELHLVTQLPNISALFLEQTHEIVRRLKAKCLLELSTQLC